MAAAAKDNGKGVVKAVAAAAVAAEATTTATAMVEKPVILMSHNTHYNTPTVAATTVDFTLNTKKSSIEVVRLRTVHVR